MASNLSNQSRNVLSKKVMVKKEVTYILQIHLFKHISICFMLLFFGVGLKTVLRVEQDSMDNITLFSIITVMSFFLLAPVALFMEGVKFTPTFLQTAVSILLKLKVTKLWFTFGYISKTNFIIFCCLQLQGLDVKLIYTRSLIAALCFHAYQQVRLSVI